MTKTNKTTATSANKRPVRKADRNAAKHRPVKPAPDVTGAPASAEPALSPRRWSVEKASLLALLERPDGAAISDLVEATGWQVHSVRAALSSRSN